MTSTDSAFPEGTVQELVDDLLVRGFRDWVILSEVDYAAGRIAESAGLTVTLSSRRTLGIEALRKVLQEGLMTAGDVMAREGFVAWGLSAPDALARIARGWEEAGAGLEMSDVCWLANTPRGDSLGGPMATAVEYVDAFAATANVPGAWTPSPELDAIVFQTLRMRTHGHAAWRQFRAALEEHGLPAGDSVLIVMHEDDVDMDYCLVGSPSGRVYRFDVDYEDLATSGLRVLGWTDITDQVPATTVANAARARALASAAAR